MRRIHEKRGLVDLIQRNRSPGLSKNHVWYTNFMAVENVNEVLGIEVGKFEGSIDGNRKYSGSPISL
jgi:hypothetical protein